MDVNRKTARAAIKTFLDDNVTTLVTSYAEEPQSVDGQSPFATIVSNGTRPGEGSTLGATDWEHEIIISICWEWNETTGPSIEGYMDDLVADVLTELDANRGYTANWAGLNLSDDFTVKSAVEISGRNFLTEQIVISIW